VSSYDAGVIDENPGQSTPGLSENPGQVRQKPRTEHADDLSLNLTEEKKDSADAPVVAALPLGDEPDQPAGYGSRAKPPKKRAAARTSVDPDWRPSGEQIAWVRARWFASDAQVAQQAEKFRDWHTAKGSLMADWAAAWRTWWLNGYHGIKRRPDGQPGTSAPVDRGADIDAQLEQRRRDQRDRP
jgi:hypothetical protein